jgi:hypothetical protein
MPVLHGLLGLSSLRRHQARVGAACNCARLPRGMEFKQMRELRAAVTVQVRRAWTTMSPIPLPPRNSTCAATQPRRATGRPTAMWRGRMARRRYEHMQRAVVVIQAALRMWHERSRFLRQRQVAVVVQRIFWRLVRGGWKFLSTLCQAFHRHSVKQHSPPTPMLPSACPHPLVASLPHVYTAVRFTSPPLLPLCPCPSADPLPPPPLLPLCFTFVPHPASRPAPCSPSASPLYGGALHPAPMPHSLAAPLPHVCTAVRCNLPPFRPLPQIYVLCPS